MMSLGKSSQLCVCELEKVIFTFFDLHGTPITCVIIYAHIY